VGRALPQTRQVLDSGFQFIIDLDRSGHGGTSGISRNYLLIKVTAVTDTVCVRADLGDMQVSLVCKESRQILAVSARPEDPRALVAAFDVSPALVALASQ
jgi:hypothetical protein